MFNLQLHRIDIRHVVSCNVYSDDRTGYPRASRPCIVIHVPKDHAVLLAMFPATIVLFLLETSVSRPSHMRSDHSASSHLICYIWCISSSFGFYPSFVVPAQVEIKFSPLSAGILNIGQQ